MTSRLIYGMSLLLLLSMSAGASTISLSGTIYDHAASDADFEDSVSGLTLGMVDATLGTDGLPEYIGTAGLGGVASSGTFDHWWSEHSPGSTTAYTLDLTETGPGTGIFSYASSSFFPIDGMLLSDGLSGHNYHFAMHLEGTTSFETGDDFTFTGDDDLWVFIGGKLVMDLGGVHGPETKTVSSAGLVSKGLATGTAYDIDIFFAERHTTESNFNITTGFSITVPGPDTLGLVLLGLFGLGAMHRRQSRLDQ